MALRLLKADLASFVEDAIKGVQIGVRAARAAGNVAELPLKLDFAIELIQSAQSRPTVTTTVTDDESHQSVDRSAQTERTVESVAANEVTTEQYSANEVTTEQHSGNTVRTEQHSGSQVVTEEAVTDTEETARNATQNTTEGGSDLEVSSYTYNSFED